VPLQERIGRNAMKKARALLGGFGRRRRGNFCFPVHQDRTLPVTFPEIP
jgi:hypothetical protein